MSLQALSFLSRTSKYYKKLAEPCLYRDLTFRVVENIQIKRSFLTLLVREDLSQYVQSFILFANAHEGYDYNEESLGVAPEELAGDFLNHIQLIQTAAFRIPLCLSSSSELFGSVFARSGSSLRSEPRVDATIALILSLSTNIERIDLALVAPQFLDHTREVLSCYETDGLITGSAFTKLQSLDLRVENMQNYVPGFLVYTNCPAKKFSLRNAYIDELVDYSMGSSKMLHKVELQNISIDPDLIERFIRRSKMDNLTYLSLDNIQARFIGAPRLRDLISMWKPRT
jgi:hypothetical protein